MPRFHVMPQMLRAFSPLALVLGTLALGVASLGCSSTPYVWATEVPAERALPPPASTNIQVGDVLMIAVRGQEPLSGQQTVGVDGTISVPNVGPVTVGGRPAKDAEAVIEKSLKTLLSEPVVSVVVVSRVIEVTVLGEVRSTGKFVLKSGDGVANALALAGGLNEFGDPDEIYLVRAGEPLRIRFRMDDLLRGGNSARAFALRDGDVLVVK